MARPFRLLPPALPVRALTRRRLLDRLGERWERRVTTVVAGAGFGKTALLVAATAEGGPPGARDVWLSCEPGDESGEQLSAGLATALGLPPTAGLGAVLDAVWAHAPAPVCLVLDDVHEIPADSDGAAVLGRLVAELSENGHVVLASREPVPVATARLATAGQLIRLTETDLLLDEAELSELAVARGVEPSLLASTGGWPALAELTATAGADLVLDYLWEEVLARIGTERADLLARFAVVGGGDDAVCAALAGRPCPTADLVAGVPLVERSATGWVVPHPLWGPALRRLLSSDDAAAARVLAAGVHRRAGRLSMAAELLAEAEAWDDIVDLLRDAGTSMSPVLPQSFGRWVRRLPMERRREPAAVLAAALELQVRAPNEALARFERAAAGFRDAGDVDGELAAIAQAALIYWRRNDAAGLMALYERAQALAGEGSRRAAALCDVGLAAVAHLAGDSTAALAALADLSYVDPVWLPTAHWLRSVAHRRSGDLDRAGDELDAGLAVAAALFADPVESPSLPGTTPHALQLEIARLRTGWLRGEVDVVLTELPRYLGVYTESGDRFLAREATLELATRSAWLGDPEHARALLATTHGASDDESNLLAQFLAVAVVGAIAVAEGDEAGAAGAIRQAVVEAMDRRERIWFWWDRATLALAYVLVPESRPGWDTESLGEANQPGRDLARALLAARDGDLSVVGGLRWPEAGVVRAHLPARWAVELAAAGTAAGNEPPDGLLLAVGPSAPTTLRALSTSSGTKVVTAAAKRLLRQLPITPRHRLRVGVLGPLELRRDGRAVDHPDLRRQRVRELLSYLVAHPRVRRDAAADDLWPDLDDPAHNLRVTLSYLQRVLQPDRAEGEAPYFLRASGPWLELASGEWLDVDAWELDRHLGAADDAEWAGTPMAALLAYRAALPLWRGEPFADVPDGAWAHAERARLQARYTAAAVRSGELLLAAGQAGEAGVAARHAVVADPASEAAYRLLARAHLALDDPSGARQAVEACRRALAELDLRPAAETLAVLDGG